jgi:predicted transcriptional regulator
MSYSTKQFAEYLGVHECTIYTYIKKGLIPPHSHESKLSNKLWSDEVVHSFSGLELRALAKKGAEKKLKKESKIDHFDLVLKTSSAIGA